MTPKERAAMQQALEALENAYENGFLTGITGLKTIDIITALREALDHSGEANEMVINWEAIDKEQLRRYKEKFGDFEQTEQEPVAWFVQYKNRHEFVFGGKPEFIVDGVVEPLYAATQPVKQEPVAWVDLEQWQSGEYDCFTSEKVAEYMTPLYTAPVRTKDLTDDEIKKLQHKIDWTAEWSYVNFARAVITAYKEKNK